MEEERKSCAHNGPCMQSSPRGTRQRHSLSPVSKSSSALLPRLSRSRRRPQPRQLPRPYAPDHGRGTARSRTAPEVRKPPSGTGDPSPSGVPPVGGRARAAASAPAGARTGTSTRRPRQQQRASWCRGGGPPRRPVGSRPGHWQGQPVSDRWWVAR